MVEVEAAAAAAACGSGGDSDTAMVEGILISAVVVSVVNGGVASNKVPPGARRPCLHVPTYRGSPVCSSVQRCHVTGCPIPRV